MLSLSRHPSPQAQPLEYTQVATSFSPTHASSRRPTRYAQCRRKKDDRSSEHHHAQDTLSVHGRVSRINFPKHLHIGMPSPEASSRRTLRLMLHWEEFVDSQTTTWTNNVSLGRKRCSKSVCSDEPCTCHAWPPSATHEWKRIPGTIRLFRLIINRKRPHGHAIRHLSKNLVWENNPFEQFYLILPKYGVLRAHTSRSQ